MHQTKRVILITGRPGIGKTTVVMKIVEELRAKGCKVGGMTSGEKREDGARVGFQIQDITTGKQGWLAHIRQPNGPKIGKYRVNINDLENIGAKAVENATENADIVVVDEIGPMELCSQAFRRAILRVVDGEKPVIATVHFKATDQLVKKIKTREDAEMFEVTLENRKNVHNVIIALVTKILKEGHS
ncbi:MAG: NTPase [Candidatus Bathyarchaeia archaeon]|jgi:nucleoside-triphosphatase|nr:NTPase [Candidatus Bathyarchaeota archaeon A05DMB-4]MDH7595816.1 NTPase [Candidatus Bathyarchaeota archaeon]